METKQSVLDYWKAIISFVMKLNMNTGNEINYLFLFAFKCIFAFLTLIIESYIMII